MRFDFWQRWGATLDDASFADAWRALGVAQAYAEHDPYAGALSQWIERDFKQSNRLLWVFPDENADPPKGAPQDWAKAWSLWSKALHGPLRLRIEAAPAREAIRPWYRLLTEGTRPPDAVSLELKAPRADFYVDWPLRVASLAEEAWSILEQAAPLWPANKQARFFRLGREDTNCDVLVHDGPASSLLRLLLDTPYPVRANILLLRGGEGEWGEIDALLAGIVAKTKASGFVLLPAAMGTKDVAERINSAVRELSHAEPLDLAMAKALSGTDVVAAFTGEVETFVLRQLADRYNVRMAALPAGTTLDMSGVGPPSEWLAKGVSGGGYGGGVARPAALTGADRRMAASTIKFDPASLPYGRETHSGSTFAELPAAMASAAPPAEAQQKRAARFLQQQSFVQPAGSKEFREAKEGFFADAPARVRVRIGEPKAGWDSAPGRFPIEELPQELERWNLTVWLTELDHLPRGLKGELKLPRDGDSTEWDFHFRPRKISSFEGRLTVVHRGRVIQTAVLRAGVVVQGSMAPKDGAPKLEKEAPVRLRLGDLDRRRQFDGAFIANHDSRGRPLLTAVSAKAAWVKDLSKVPAIATDINSLLSPVAKSVQDYQDGLDGKNGEELLVQLAQQGGALRDYLHSDLDDPANNAATAENDYLQIVSTRPDAVVPLEFVYDYTVPEDGAKVCRGWRDAVKDGECATGCDHSSGKTVCPMGFWGVRKVIERHAVRPGLAADGKVLYLQSETSRESDKLYLGGVAVMASSDRVPPANVDELKKVVKKHCGADPQVAETWDKWEELVKELHPSLLLALAHTDGRNANVTLQIGTAPGVKTVTLRNTHVFPPPPEGRQAPLLALIGCDVAGTGDDYGNHVFFLRERGAGIVIGTIATVFGVHAAQVAEKLVEGMLPAAGGAPVRLGELIREVRRKALLDNLLMPLCLVAYGDADWILMRKPANG